MTGSVPLAPSRRQTRHAFWTGIGSAGAVGVLSTVCPMLCALVWRSSSMTQLVSAAGLVLFWCAEIAAIGIGVRGVVLAKRSEKQMLRVVAAFAYITTSVGFLFLPLFGLGVVFTRL
jgi:hypothetical protein